MKRVIEGVNPIPGFNGSQNIDLNVYQEIDIPTQIDGTFSHIGSIKLDDVDEDDSIWLNDAVRADGNTLERIEDFVNNFEVTGYFRGITTTFFSQNFKITFSQKV